MKKLSSIILLVCVTSLFALQGGPTQPDYIQFEPSEMKDMVSLTSGNFAYSIPLGEVPGAYGSYPLSLSYHAGVSPQQEATWVGLGWTLSPGSIVRDVRGVPDDQFHGGTLGFIYQYSAMYTWGLDLSFSEGPYSVGVNVSSTGGVGVSATIGPDLEGGSLGFTVSTNQGVGVSGGVGFGGNRFGLNASVMFSPGSGDVSFGGGVSMVGGDKNQAYKASLGVQYTTGQDVSMHVGLSAKSKDSKNFANVIGASVRKNGVSSSLGAVTVSVANSTAKGSSTSSSTGFSIVVPTNVGVFSLGFNQTLHEYHMRAATSDYVYGFLYQGGPAIIADRDNNIDDIPNAQTGAGKSTGRIPWTWTFKGRSMETLGESKMQPAYDMFTIESEGVAGTFRAFPREEHQMFNLVSNQATDDKKTLEYYHPILELDARRWPETEDFVYKDRENLENTAREPSLYKSYKANSSVNSAFADYKTHFRNEGNRLVYRVDEDYDKQPLNSGMKFLFLGEGGYYKSEMLGGAKNFGPNDVSNSLLKRVLKDRDANEQQFALYGSRKVEPIFEDVSPASKIKGFVITNSNGTKYFFTTPVKTYLKVDYTINQEKGVPVFVDKKLSKNAGLLDNIGNALSTVFWPPKLIRGIKKAVTGHLDETCKADNADETYLYTYQINMNPYATQWLLTEIQGPDFVELDKNDMSQNIGYNVKFNYTEPSLYQWRTPYAQPNALSSDLPNSRVSRNGLTPKGCDTKMYQSAFGVKEYVYLESIETATHKVKFELNDPKTEERVDGKGWYFKKDKTEKTLPILTTAALSLRVKSVNKKADNSYVYDKTILSFPVYTATYEYDALYVNVDIPKLLQDNLKNNPKLYLTTDFYKKYIQFKYKDANGKEKDADAFIFNSDENEIAVEVDNLAENMVEKTSGDEARFGLYKIKLKKGVDTKELLWRPSSNNNMSLFDYASNGMVKIVLSENGMAFAVNNLDKTIDDNKYNLKQCIVKPSFVLDNKFKQCGDFANEAKSLITPMIDWSDIVFAENQNSPMNQMRYLKKILYYKKRKSDNSDVTEQTAGGQINKPYREYNFEYDYSLHPRTLNSYCLPNNSDKSLRYPKDLSDIQDSPIKADLNICYTDKTSRNLYGKLTLKSITEIGCQNGRCSSLPPFKFDYNAPSQTSTRFSTKDAWEETSKLNVPNIFDFSTSSSSDDNQASNKREQFYSDEYYSNITDVEASIIASENTSDEWGFWNNLANEDNRKVNQSFANYGAAAWSLNKITDPAGGVMEIKYERDVYKNGEDHSSERLYASLFRVGTCSSLIKDYNMNVSIDPKYRGKACMMLLPQYWKDQCLGPRSAYWSYVRPKNYKGGMFDYMEEMGLVKDNQINQDTTVYFNLRSEVKTEVKCGVGGAFDCDRFRDVGLLGSTKFLAMYEGSVGINNNELPFELKQEHSLLEIFSNKKTNHVARMIVLNKDFDMIEAGIQMASNRINKDQYWDIMGVSGKMWVKRDYATMKGGDIRVKSLVRYDIDRIAKTEYEYDPGEMSQLPDSAYTTVMGNRFNANVISYAMPDLNMKPKSRIVGFEDDDLLYVPGSTIMYPKVTVKNSDGQGKITNGKTEFEYITPERGIPEDFIDQETRDELKPFIHINANLMVWKDGLLGFLIDHMTKKIDINNIDDIIYETKPYVVTFEFYNKDGNIVGKPKNVLLYQDRSTSFNIYSESNVDVTAIRKIKAYKDGSKAQTVEIDVDHLTKFNEVSLTFAVIKDETIRLYKNWQRSQELGYYPILYKKISYGEKGICIHDCNPNNKTEFEEKIVYYDFTAFLGMNKKISFYRGNDDKAILLKVDSSVYSTKVPDVLEGIAQGSENEIAKKIGMQIERWNSKRELHCVVAGREEWVECRKGLWSLSALLPNTVYDEENKAVTYYQDEVSFEYRRYPVFKTKSITMNGFDNQEKQFDKSSSSSLSSSSSELFLSSACDDRCQRNRKRWHWSVIENHKYDPVTGNPTATLAKIPAEGGGELRKLTLKLPQHAVLEKINGNTAKPTELAQLLFKKNMLSQNYAEFVYFDSKPVDESAPWNNLKENQYLKSFSIAPLNRFKGNLLYTTVDGDKKTLEKQKYPYIDMGSFSTKSEPNQIVGTENPYFYVAKYHVEDFETSKDKWPNKRDFSGNHILQVDKYFRPVEVEDELKRLLSAHYTDDGLHQTGLFFPSALNKTASIVPYGDEISEVNIKTSIKDNLKVDFEKGGMVVQSSINLSKSIVENGDELVAEYRYKKAGQTWQTKRENVNDLNLSLKSGDVLNYLRIYPKKAEAKTYIYDLYGNIIQIVAEDNTSTFYEYNSFGQLIQSRNDDGVSFKSHHREFWNDDRDEIKWKNSVMMSSSSGN